MYNQLAIAIVDSSLDYQEKWIGGNFRWREHISLVNVNVKEYTAFAQEWVHQPVEKS